MRGEAVWNIPRKFSGSRPYLTTRLANYFPELPAIHPELRSHSPSVSELRCFRQLVVSLRSRFELRRRSSSAMQNRLRSRLLGSLFYWSSCLRSTTQPCATLSRLVTTPYDVVGSFGVMVRMLIALLSLARAFRPYREARPQCDGRISSGHRRRLSSPSS